MNKTVNMNLGGLFFHIDEDAYQKLTRYFDAIKRYLSNSSGQDEIIKDIEMRVSELLTEKQKTDKHVVGLKDVDEVIAVMGQPEDYKIDDEDCENTATKFASTKVRKLFRDKENGMIGGVLAGLGHYFGIDKVWLRVLFLIMIFAWGIGLLPYIILWIVMPEAKTTAEKLEMTGEPVTISNIEKKVREEFDAVSDKIKNANYDEMGNLVKTEAGKIGSSLGSVFTVLLSIFSKFLGVFLIVIGLLTLAGLFIGLFTLSSFSGLDLPWQGFIDIKNLTDYPAWLFGSLLFFSIGIPFFFLSLLGFKLLSPNLKSIGNVAKYTLLAVWLISVSLAIAIGIKQASAFAAEGRVVQKENINLKSSDTLYIKFIHNPYFSKTINDHDTFRITKDSTGNDVLYSNNIIFRILKTEAKTPYLQIEKEAKGSNLFEAKQRAEKINYGYKFTGNQLILDNYLISDLKEKFRNQEIEISLFLPKETLFKADSSVQDYDYSDNDYFNLHYSSSDYLYKVEKEQIKCLTCPKEENEYNDSDNYDKNDSIVTTTVTVNGKVVKIKETVTKSGLSVNQDGVIIKTH